MANPFLQDFLNDLEEIEEDKTSFGTTSGSLFDFDEPTSQPEKNFLWDVIGSTAWAFADEASFSGLSLGAWALDQDVDQFHPESLTAKIGAGIGTLGGFAMGLPMKVGAKGISMAAKPFLKKAVKDVGEKGFKVATTKQIQKAVTKEAVDAGIKKEVIKDFTRDFGVRSARSTFNKDIAKNFLVRSNHAIDNLANEAITAGKMTAEEAGIATKIFKNHLTRRPMQNFKDLWSIRGGNPKVGNLLDEALMFGMIDAIREVPMSIAQEREYDVFAPLWGVGIGAGFGALKFLSPAGKGSNFRVDLTDGIKAAFGKNIYKGKTVDQLAQHSKMLGNTLRKKIINPETGKIDYSDDTLNSIKQVLIGDTKYTFNLMAPYEVVNTHGRDLGKKILEKGLNEYGTEYGNKLLKYAVKEEWQSLSENFWRMMAGGIMMNAHGIYEMTAHDADMPAEDLIPGMLIGAWMNRRGTPRTWDIGSEVNKMRDGMHVLGYDTRNLLKIPGTGQIGHHMNPISYNEGLKNVRNKAEELGILTNDFGEAEAPIAGESALMRNQNKGDLDIYMAFHNMLLGDAKIIKSIDKVKATDAFEIQDMLKAMKWERLNNQPVKNARDFWEVSEDIMEGAAGSFEESLVNTVFEMQKALEIKAKLDPTMGTMGQMPKEFEIPSVDRTGEMPSLYEYARQGHLFKGIEGLEGLEGPKAEAAMTEILLKANKVVDVLSRANRVTLTEKSKEITDAGQFQELTKIIFALENKIDNAITSPDSWKFDFLTHGEDLVSSMVFNNLKTGAKNLSTLFSIGAPGHDSLVKNLMNVLMHGDRAQPNIIPSVRDSNIKVTGEKGPESKRFLGQILRILQNKNWGTGKKYNVESPTDPIEISQETVDGLKKYLGQRGMKTDPGIMGEFNDFTIRYIQQENIRDSRLTMSDLGIMMEIQGIPEVDLVSFSADGFKVRKIKEAPHADIEYSNAIQRYNNFVEQLYTKGKGVKGNLIGADESIVLADNGEGLIRLIDSKLDYLKADSFNSSRQALNDLFNSLHQNYPAFVGQMQKFANESPEYAKTLESMLQNTGMIERNVGDSYIKYKFKEEGITPDTIEFLKSGMAEYGVDFGTVEAQYKAHQSELKAMETELYSTSHGDESLTQDQFFNKYLLNDVGMPKYDTIDSQNDWLTTILGNSIPGGKLIGMSTAPRPGVPSQAPKGIDAIIKDVFRFRKGDTFVSGKDLNLSNPSDSRLLGEAKDHFTSLLVSKKNATKVEIISWKFGQPVFNDLIMQRSGLNDLFGNMDINLRFASGTSESMDITPGGARKWNRKQINMFDLDSEYLMLNADQRSTAKGRAKAFEDALGIATLVPNARNKYDENPLDLTGGGLKNGAGIFRIADKIQPIVIANGELPKLVDSYERLYNRVKSQISEPLKKHFTSNISEMRANPHNKTSNHVQALRQMMFAEISIEGNNYKDFIDLLAEDANSNGSTGKISKRLSLWSTPNFKRYDRMLAEGTGRNRSDVKIINKFISEKGEKLNVIIKEDAHNIKGNLLKHFKEKYGDQGEAKFNKFWDVELHGRSDESSFDSISYISSDYMRFLSLSMGRAVDNTTQIFKPVISSTGDVLLLGKTVFIHEPSLETFMKGNDVDILTMDSASKVKGPGWNTLNELPPDNVFLTKEQRSQHIRQIDLRSVGIKQDRIHLSDVAKQSQSSWNYLNSDEAKIIYNEFYDARLTKALGSFESIFNNPDLRKLYFSGNSIGNNQSTESLFEGSSGSANIGALKYASKHNMDPIELGDRMISNQLYQKLIDPIINPKAQFGNNKYGGKAVLIQSQKEILFADGTTGDRYLRPTLVEGGKLTQYGQVALPAYEMETKLKVLERKGMSLKAIRMSDQTLMDVAEIPLFRQRGKDIELTKESILKQDWNLGQLHEMVSGGGEYELAIITNRYPRTRPNDMAIMGLRGFLNQKYGNAMIVNEMDVLNIFEGDYDVDKNDYYFMHSEALFKHIQSTVPKWAQGIDVGQFATEIEGLKLAGEFSSTDNTVWSQQIGNANVLKKGIGTVQKMHRSLNWLRDLASPEMIGKNKDTEVSTLMKMPDGSRIIMDYNNKDWWHRAVLETQAIIDAGTSTDLLSADIMSWKKQFLFPKFSESVSFGEQEKNQPGFLRDIRTKKANKKVRLFRKIDKNGNEIKEDFTQFEIDNIDALLGEYSNFLSLGSTMFEKTGVAKSPSYHDVIELSERYFMFLGDAETKNDLSRRVFYKMLKKHKNSSHADAFRAAYKPDDMPKSLPEGVERTKDDFIPINTASPFVPGLVDRASDIAKGIRGNVFDKAMYNIWKNDPLKTNTYKTFDVAEMQFMDEYFYKTVEFPEARDNTKAELLGFTSTLNTSMKALAFLKKKFGFIESLKISPDRKLELKDQLNEDIMLLEDKIGVMIPKQYTKTKSGKDIVAGLVQFVNIEGKRELVDDAVQLATMDALTRLNHGTVKMKDDIAELHHLERRMYGDMKDLGATQDYADASIMSERMSGFLKGSPKDHNDIGQLIDMQLRRGIDAHGMSFLWHYAMPSKKPNGVGIFNGELHAVPYSGNGRMKRIIRFMAKNAQANKDVDMEQAFKGLGSILGYYRNYYNRDWKFSTGERIIDPDIVIGGQQGMTLSHLQFPSFTKQFETGLDSFKDFKWRKQTGSSPGQFKFHDNAPMEFYKEFFALHGMGENFNEFVHQRSMLNSELESNRIMDPMRYLSTISQMDGRLHEFVNNRVTGLVAGRGKETNVFPVDARKLESMKGNAIYALLGGSKYFKGLTLSPMNHRSKESIANMFRYGEHSKTVMTEHPSDGTMRNLRRSFEHCFKK